MNSEPPPWPFTVCTTFQACCLFFSGSVPMNEIVSSPRWLVAQTGPNFGCMKLAPRPGCGVWPFDSITPTSLSSLVSTIATLWRAFAATRK